MYVWENALVPSPDRWIGQLLDDEHLDATCDALAAASSSSTDDSEARQQDLRRRLKQCDAKLAKYRALLEHNGDIAVVADWIVDVEQERRAIERELGRKPSTRNQTRKEIRALIGRLKEITAVLADSDPGDKRAVYEELGVRIAYHPDGRVLAESRPHVVNECVGGAIRTIGPRGAPEGKFRLAA